MAAGSFLLTVIIVFGAYFMSAALLQQSTVAVWVSPLTATPQQAWPCWPRKQETMAVFFLNLLGGQQNSELGSNVRIFSSYGPRSKTGSHGEVFCALVCGNNWNVVWTCQWKPAGVPTPVLYAKQLIILWSCVNLEVKVEIDTAAGPRYQHIASIAATIISLSCQLQKHFSNRNSGFTASQKKAWSPLNCKVCSFMP